MFGESGVGHPDAVASPAKSMSDDHRLSLPGFDVGLGVALPGSGVSGQRCALASRATSLTMHTHAHMHTHTPLHLPCSGSSSGSSSREARAAVHGAEAASRGWLPLRTTSPPSFAMGMSTMQLKRCCVPPPLLCPPCCRIQTCSVVLGGGKGDGG